VQILHGLDKVALAEDQVHGLGLVDALHGKLHRVLLPSGTVWAALARHQGTGIVTQVVRPASTVNGIVI